MGLRTVQRLLLNVLDKAAFLLRAGRVGGTGYSPLGSRNRDYTRVAEGSQVSVNNIS
jgi:hypothetical protein